MSILEVSHVKKIYTTRFGGSKVQALSDVNFTVEEGEYVAIMGESGSGKTTLLNILAALDKPTSGEVRLEGKNLADIREAEIASFRRDHLGFVFQDFNLLDTFSLKDNIFLPLVLAGKKYPEMDQRLRPIAKKLGIGDILSKYPYEVSGGQKQRAAVARALITNPRLVLADEPTGALDSRSTDELLRLFEEINRDGQTLVMVTHSVKAASHAGRVLFIKDGEVFHQIYRGESSDDELYQKISDTLTMLATSAGGNRNA
jgi:putative ABC transport system ATP-binding protein